MQQPQKNGKWDRCSLCRTLPLRSHRSYLFPFARHHHPPIRPERSAWTQIPTSSIHVGRRCGVWRGNTRFCFDNHGTEDRHPCIDLPPSRLKLDRLRKVWGVRVKCIKLWFRPPMSPEASKCFRPQHGEGPSDSRTMIATPRSRNS